MTLALQRADTAAAAATALYGATGKAEVEGLVELIHRPPSARAAILAIDALARCDAAIVLDALGAALCHEAATVRLAAVQSLHRRGAARFTPEFVRLLREDDSWPVRRAALHALADLEGERWHVLAAHDDPHWRVRHALIQVLLRWGDTDERCREIDERLTALRAGPRVEGVRAYLHYRWTGAVPEPSPMPDDPLWRSAVWDWDHLVLARNLERLDAAGRREALEVLPRLLAHPEPRVQALAVEALRAAASAEHRAAALAQLDDPRTGAGAAVAKLLSYLDLDECEELARHVLRLPAPTPAQLAWALDQAGPTFPPEEEQAALRGLFVAITSRRAGGVSPLIGRSYQGADAPRSPAPLVRRALARLAGRWQIPESESWLRTLFDDADPSVRLEALRGLMTRSIPLGADCLAAAYAPLRAEAVRVVTVTALDVAADDEDPTVRVVLAERLAQTAPDSPLLSRLQADAHPHVRAAALTPQLAMELMTDPGRETSWHVLARAARLAQTPLWHLTPKEPWQPPPEPPFPGPLTVLRAAPPFARRLGRDGPLVAPLALSGHYGLPVEGFVRGVESGVNLLFWEPNYHTLTEFSGRISPADRAALHFIAGTFEADGKRVRRDAERALRVLKLERLSLFLVFWVQSWARITPDVREALERLKDEGKVAAYSLSTHQRSLAVEAMERGWDPVMVRHSAAHRGAEERVLPRAVELGTGIITFNVTCYGRLLKRHGDAAPPRPSDCFRYTLARPGVTACLTAPATLEYLEENLTVLSDPELLPEREAELEAQGRLVYQEDTTFRRLVRSR